MAGPPDGYITLENFPTVGDDPLSGRRPYQLDGAASLSQIERTASLPHFSGRSNIMKRGIYAGSFDPPTRGHLDVIRRASLIVDELHIMIGVNPKKSGGFFPVTRRLQLIEESLEHMAWFGGRKSTFHVGEFTGLLIDYCREHDIRFNIRGLRAAQDFNYEFEMHGINCDMAPEINTIFLIAPPEFQFISSSTIKELASYQSPALRKYVTPSVASALLDANQSLSSNSK